MTPLVLAGLMAIAASGAVAAQSVQGADQPVVEAPVVNLRALDTLSGASEEITIGIGETVRFGMLEITVETCQVPEADPAAEAFAFLNVADMRETEPRFTGWMFSASPGLSALDHPRYDVWLMSCSMR